MLARKKKCLSNHDKTNFKTHKLPLKRQLVYVIKNNSELFVFLFGPFVDIQEIQKIKKYKKKHGGRPRFKI